MTGHNTDLANMETVPTFKTHLAIIFLSRMWKWRHKQMFFLIFKVSATIPTYSTASRAFSLVDERSVNTFLPVYVYASLNTSVLYSEPLLQHKIRYICDGDVNMKITVLGICCVVWCISTDILQKTVVSMFMCSLSHP
jgi:hypothetical protein